MRHRTPAATTHRRTPGALLELDEYRRMAEVEQAHWWYGATRALLAELLGPWLRPGARVLDAGCGTGATGAWMADAGADLVGADVEPLALALYRGAHPARGLAAADVARLPFADGSFDVVLCVTVLCHRSLPDPQRAVDELARVVRPGGVLCLQEPGVRALRRAHDRVTHSARRFSRHDLAGMAAAAGLEVRRATGAYSFLVPPAAVKAVLERGRTASDLDRARDGLRGVLPALAAVERRWLARQDLPAGLSVVTVATRPGGADGEGGAAGAPASAVRHGMARAGGGDGTIAASS